MLLTNSVSVHQFLASEALSTYEQASVVILPIPYEATTTFRKGCQQGPAALLEASDQLEAYDDELGKDTCHELGIYTHPFIADTNLGEVPVAEMLSSTQRAVEKLLDDGKFVIAVGGEHSITGPIVQAYYQREQEPFTVVQIDAHGDMRHEYEGSIHNHACVMRRVLDLGLPTLPVGIRSICLEEAQLIEREKIPVIWSKDIANNPEWIKQALSQIKTKKVFITIDVDGIDPSLMPGVGTPEPGGLSWYGLMEFLRGVFTNHQVLGCDVMELAPVSDSVVSQFTAAKLVYKLIGYYSLQQQ